MHPYPIFQRLPVCQSPLVCQDSVHVPTTIVSTIISPNDPEDYQQTLQKDHQNNLLWEQIPDFLKAVKKG